MKANVKMEDANSNNSGIVRPIKNEINKMSDQFIESLGKLKKEIKMIADQAGEN